MSKDKRSVEFKAVMTIDKMKTYLMDLLASMDDGVICVESGDACVSLEPKEMVKVEIEAKEKKGKSKFSLKLTWQNEIEIKKDDSTLKISSTVPEPVAAETASDEPAEDAGSASDNMTEDEKAEERRHGE